MDEGPLGRLSHAEPRLLRGAVRALQALQQLVLVGDGAAARARRLEVVHRGVHVRAQRVEGVEVRLVLPSVLQRPPLEGAALAAAVDLMRGGAARTVDGAV